MRLIVRLFVLIYVLFLGNLGSSYSAIASPNCRIAVKPSDAHLNRGETIKRTIHIIKAPRTKTTLPEEDDEEDDDAGSSFKTFTAFTVAYSSSNQFRTKEPTSKEVFNFHIPKSQRILIYDRCIYFATFRV
ncbi:MAG: hypothetical protein JSS78_06025 [Bacteroidetes bacterium]|nr:hypothetical protein [Bacteroidota bacterium]